MGRLNGKIAVVTGAGSGIGRGISEMFAKEGAKVVAVDYNVEEGQKTLDTIKKGGGQGIFVECNVRNKDDIKKLVKQTIDTYGDITTLVNCAGILVHKPYLEHTDEDYQKVGETNFRAYFWMMQEFLPYLIKNGHSSIINLASISVMKPETNSYIYGAFKAAINKMTRDMTREFTPQGVRLNVICPGPVLTNLTPEKFREEARKNPEAAREVMKKICSCGRQGVPEDIAYGAVYLASDEADWVSGTTLVIDGGACNFG